MVNRRRFLTVTAAGIGGASSLAALGATAGESGVRPAPTTPDPHLWDDNTVTLAWLGHATVLINFYGVRVLTDPVLFPRIGIDAWVTTIGPLRLTYARCHHRSCQRSTSCWCHTPISTISTPDRSPPFGAGLRR